MTWGELVDNIRDLGFEEDSTMQDASYRSITINAVNRAIDTIFWNVVEPYKTYFREESKKPTVRVVDETAETDKKPDGEKTVVDIPVITGTAMGISIGDYDTKNIDITSSSSASVEVDSSSYEVTVSLKDANNCVWSDGTNSDKTYRVIRATKYTWACPEYPLKKITGETNDDYSLTKDEGLPDKCIYLIPLLASYYVWLDDDVEKAVYYYNMYDSELSKLLDTIKSRNGKVVMYGGLEF